MRHWATLLFALAATLPLTGLAGEQTVTLTEHLNRRWTNERVSWDLDFPAGTAADSIRVRDANGQLLPCQIVSPVVDLHNITAATIAIMVDELAPLATQHYTVSFGPKQADTPNPGELTGPVWVTAAPDPVQWIDNRRVRIESVYNDQKPGPIAPATATTPAEFIRFADGPTLRFGLYGDVPVASRVGLRNAGGPVMGSIGTTTAFGNGSELYLAFSIDAQNARVTIYENRIGDSDGGWYLDLGPVAETGGVLHSIIGQRSYAKEKPWPLATQAAGETFLTLSPWVGDMWWQDKTNAFRLPLGADANARQLVVSVRHTGAWVEPSFPPPWGRFDQWDFPVIGEMWEGWTSAGVPISVVDGRLRLSFPARPGTRVIQIGLESDAEGLLKRYRREEMSGISPMPSLEEVQRLVLDWPDGARRHPVALLTPEQLAAAKAQQPDLYTRIVDPKAAAGYLNKLSNFDIFRYAPDAAGYYDAVIDSPDLPPQRRRLLRAQMAYLAYVNADPLHWSFERGMASGNPNMTVARVTNVGKLACVLYDHPMADHWMAQTTRYLDFWLAEVVDPDGGWPESSHYARVAVAEMLLFAIMSRNVGYTNYFDNPTFLRMAEFYAKTQTPPDPMRRLGRQVSITPDSAGKPVRVGAPYGRGTRGDAWGLAGLWAAATATSHPAFSRRLQWAWAGSGYTTQISHGFAGQEWLYLDASLPQEKPDWRSEYLSSLGYLLRDRLGEPDESYLLQVTEDYQSPDGHIWPPDVGSVAKWFAQGVPIAGHFRRIPEETSPLLVNRVVLATNNDPAAPAKLPSGGRVATEHLAAAFLPGLDYTDTRYTVRPVDHWLGGQGKTLPAFPLRQAPDPLPEQWRWRRRLLVDHGPTGFLLLHDSVETDLPTQWQFWTLSEQILAADALSSAPLPAPPGAANAPLRELSGDRFTAIGRFGMHLHVQVLAPRHTPRYTLRAGHKDGAAYGIQNFAEFQDLLYLQREDAGDYVVLLLPRPADAARPETESLADGQVLRIRDGAHTTWLRLGIEDRDVKVDGHIFAGPVVSVQVDRERSVLSLPRPGKIVTTDGLRLESPRHPAHMVVAGDSITITLPPDLKTVEFIVRAPGAWAPAAGQDGVATRPWTDGATAVTAPAGTTDVRLGRR